MHGSSNDEDELWRRLDWNDVRTFLAVAEAGSLNAAAGVLRMTQPTISRLMMPELPSFQMANPEIHLAIDCGLWPDGTFDGDTDIAIDMNEAATPDYVSMPIATMHYCLFASAEYLRVYGTPRSLAEVADHRWVRHTSHKEQTSTWHPKAAAVGELAGQQLISNSSATTLQAIKHGAGIGALPTYVLNLEPDLVMLDLDPMAHPFLFLRHHASAVRQDRIMRVKDWIIGLFDATDRPWYRDEFIHPRDWSRMRGRPAPRRVVRSA
jgi:DNA-binding transcriptional LysR family regulator